jgi:hypothetical protein
MPLPPCPHLPPAPAGIACRLLHAHRDAHRRSDFYLDCLEYAHSLWQRDLVARAILCLDRAFGAELSGDEPVLARWPLPYAALVWILKEAPAGRFLGNPRVHFQHYAGRMSGPRLEQRRWRAWACWALTRSVLPQLPGDPRHPIAEPDEGQISAQLAAHGHPGEERIWRGVSAAS